MRLSVRGDVAMNKLPRLAQLFPRSVHKRIVDEILETKQGVEDNIRKYDLIDTGRMLGSVTAQMQSWFEGNVDVTAVSDAGFPYPAAQNYGTRFIPASPFFSDEVREAEKRFPKRFADLGGELV
jgi:hypothetical protein